MLDWCDELDLLTIGAYPFRESNPLLAHPLELLKRLHALDLNAKDLHSYGAQMRERIAEFSQQIGIPYIAGSDTHHPLQLGSVYNRSYNIEGYADLRSAIEQRNFHIFIAQDPQHCVKSATLVKKLLKERGNVVEAFI